jgi:hypothetical protein
VAVCVEQGEEGSDDSTNRGTDQSRPRRSRPAEEKDTSHDEAADHQLNQEVLRTAAHQPGWKHEHAPLSNRRYRTATNVCGQPCTLQIRRQPGRQLESDSACRRGDLNPHPL